MVVKSCPARMDSTATERLACLVTLAGAFWCGAGSRCVLRTGGLAKACMAARLAAWKHQRSGACLAAGNRTGVLAWQQLGCLLAIKPSDYQNPYRGRHYANLDYLLQTTS